MFQRFNYQTLIAELPEINALTQLSADTAQTKLPEDLLKAGCRFEGFVLDFSDDLGLELFLKEYKGHQKQWAELDKGMLDAREYFNPSERRKEYPIFTVVNPLGMAYDDRTQEELGLKGFGRAFRNITKYGRVHLAITPDKLVNTGTNWPDVPKSYTDGLAQPDQTLLKMPLCRWLVKRPMITTYGLEQRSEDPYGVFTPQTSILQQAILKEMAELKLNQEKS
jgi:hypothetical protein